MTPHRKAAAIVAALALLVLGSADATASTVAVDGSTLVYTAATGELNQVRFTLHAEPGANGIQIEDTGAEISSGSGGTCLAGHNDALCNAAGITAIRVALGDGHDSVDFAPDIALPVTVDGGAGPDEINGSPKADKLVGGAGDDSISGGAGNDVVDGGEGKDVLSGGEGSDTVSGGADEDTVKGDEGDDSLSGGAGDDKLDGGTGSDTLDGGLGGDSIAGGTDKDGKDVDTVSYAGRSDAVNVDLNNNPDDGTANENDDVQNDVEVVIGGSGNDRLAGRDDAGDVLIGGPGDDQLIGRGGNDTLDGGDGTDLLDGGTGADSINGGAGEDSVTYGSRANGVTVSLDDNANDGEPGEGDNVHTDVEELYGGAGDDTLVGDDGRNLIGGQGGNDVIQGMGGDDVLNGGEGADTISGGDGKDIVNYAWESDSVSVSYDGVANDGAPGENDNLAQDVEGVIGSPLDDRLLGGPGNDFLYGYGGNDTILGGPGADMIVGSDGDETIQSMDGAADFVSCGDGKDIALVDAKDSVAGDCETKVVGTAVSVITPAAGLRAAGGTVAVPLACQKLIVDGCSGTVTLTVVAPGQAKAHKKKKAKRKKRSHKRAKKSAATAKPQPIAIGTASFLMAPGATVKQPVTLSPQVTTLLAQHRKLVVTATATNTDAAGGVSVAKQTFVLYAGKR